MKLPPIVTSHARRFLGLVSVSFWLLALDGSAARASDGEIFHNAPAEARGVTNPESGPKAVQEGQAIFAARCGACHGEAGQGAGNVPALASGPTQQASPGALFWFIGKGDVDAGMPAWDKDLSAVQRWRVVAFLKTLPQRLKSAAAAEGRAAPPTPLTLPLPTAPFADFRTMAPGNSRKITVADLPKPYETESSANAPRVVPRPDGAWPKVPPGFTVGLYSSGLTNPRMIRRAPNGDMVVTETEAGRIRIFRGLTADGQPQTSEIFVSGLTHPFGIAFYPAGIDPHWIYVADTNAVLRIPYRSGDLTARGPAEKLADLPASESGHKTRDIQFSLDGASMFVSVGSKTNVTDIDATADERERADILRFNPDGSGRSIYASGIRNAVGLAINPMSGELWCSVNERDALGDNLVPDYITHVEPNGFYGWPFWYVGGQQDPRFPGKHPELKEKLILPDVLLQPHTASLGMTFYDGDLFPADYKGDIFAAEHGSWNRSVRTGYELIRVPLHQTARASGEYEDFMTGFVIDNDTVWGRPVGVAVAPDGALLVTDDGSGSIWRIARERK